MLRSDSSCFWKGSTRFALVLTFAFTVCTLLNFATNSPLFADETDLPTDVRSSSGSAAIDVDHDAVVAMIDSYIRTAWKDNDLRPAVKATDAQWCRRVYLDLIGRVPTVVELKAFVNERSKTKKVELVDRLLGSEYREAFTEHWTAIWTNTLIGRTGGTQRRSLTSREGMADFLRTSLLENKPYNQLVHELLTATGRAKPTQEDYNGAVNFLIEKMGEGGIQATTKTAEIFLGTAVQCTQCHNHPFNEYRQNQFWELSAFFKQTRTERMQDPEDEDNRIGMLVDRDFAGEGRMLYDDSRREIFLEERNGKLVDRDAQQMYDAPIYYELRNGKVQVAYPVFIDGTSLIDELASRDSEFGNSGYLEHVKRREELSRLLTGYRDFDRALVNRLWAHFFGYGFTKPIHDMGPHNPASHPELLDKLGLAFRNSGFDTKAVLRWIVLSEPYALSSKISRGNSDDDPSLGVPPQFSRFYIRQMQAEQLFQSLLVVTQAEKTFSKEDSERMQKRWLDQFNTAFGTDDGGEASSFNGSIPQTLMMMNGDLINRACRTNSGSFLDKVANNPKFSNRDKIHYLYLAALSRAPTKTEINTCNALLDSRKGKVVSTLQDIWWAVLNSNEFILIH